VDRPPRDRMLVLLADDEQAIGDGLVQFVRQTDVYVGKPAGGGPVAVASPPARARLTGSKNVGAD
jgi:hypothetical protein